MILPVKTSFHYPIFPIEFISYVSSIVPTFLVHLLILLKYVGTPVLNRFLLNVLILLQSVLLFPDGLCST